ncbi:MAG TPA: S8 family peptidase [Candidatus Choladousia intestinigallinarum]|nr:S8 family peptidase [Candidatus Choladousia intestinigallinarum]
MNSNRFLMKSAQSSVSPAVSEEYSDLIYRYQEPSGQSPFQLDRYYPQIVNSQYVILHVPISEGFTTIKTAGYATVPKLFTPLSTVSLEDSGILTTLAQPVLDLTGQGVLIGFLDSGIDYTHPAFRNTDGSTRILGLWDQTDQRGTPPLDLSYGTEYGEDEINQALRSADPYSIVPQRDDLGHGTAVAGIACGSPDRYSDFYGAAPGSGLLVVKLKQAKQYLRDYFLTLPGAPVYQETDLMLGVRYLVQTARTLQRPLVICIALGTNQGGHTGVSPLENVLTSSQSVSGVYVCTAAGNEAGKGHHYYGKVKEQGDSLDVELLVNDTTDGFICEFWAHAPELYSIGFTSPLGETVQPVSPRSLLSQEFSFLLENSRITLDYEIVESLSGSQLALIRFIQPSTGLWRLKIVNREFINGTFHMWLPISGLVNPEVRFYMPNPDTTLVIPSLAEAVLTTSTYNAYNGSLFIHSSRGYTRNGILKPDLASPGVDVTAPALNGGFSPVTGSSAACALLAGASALLVEWGLKRPVPRFFSANELKNLFLRGTVRKSSLLYPNREWGYGTMNLYGIFESLIES